MVTVELGARKEVDLLLEVIQRVIDGQPRKPYDNLVLITLRLSLETARENGTNAHWRFDRAKSFFPVDVPVKRA